MIDGIYWRLSSIYKNLRKKKYKALLRYLYDSDYRKDVDYMLNLVRAEPMELTRGFVRLGDIVQSHDVNYYSWIINLRRQIRHKGSGSLEPLKIVWDFKKSKFLVVDGNHRFIALLAELGKLVVVEVNILVPKNKKRRSHDSKMV